MSTASGWREMTLSAPMHEPHTDHTHAEIHILECQRTASLRGQRLRRNVQTARCRLLLPTRNETAGGTDRPEFRGLRQLLGLCRQKGLFGHGYLHPPQAAGGDARTGYRRARPRRARRDVGDGPLLLGDGVCAQRAGRTAPTGLPHDMGRRPAPVSHRPGPPQARHRLRRYERGPQGD